MPRLLLPSAAAILVLVAGAAQAQPAADAPLATAPVPPSAAPAEAPPPSQPPPSQPPPAATAPLGSVQVSTLAAPDAFTTPARDTGLPPILWRGTSLAIVKTVLPILAERPVSPAAAALARRVLATGAPGPEGAGPDPALTAARAAALMNQGDPKGADAILARAPGLDRDPGLARVAAESALIAGDEARACGIEEALTSGRDELYWVRLRTFCQAIAGKTAEAQLTFDLAQSQGKDPVFARLMGAKLAGAGDPGPASLRNGLDYALSRSLGLDLSQARASPAIAAALSGAAPADASFDLGAVAPEFGGAAQAIASGSPVSPAVVERLLDAADTRDPKLRARAQAAALIVAALSQPPGPTLRARLAAMSTPEGRSPAGRNQALIAAAADKRIGEAALLALWISAETGPSGLAIADRARIVGALADVGLAADARAFALEGLLALK